MPSTFHGVVWESGQGIGRGREVILGDVVAEKVGGGFFSDYYY